MIVAARVFLYVLAILYIGLGIWCAVAPSTTSKKVGFERIGEAGRSEFMTVYGGLEVGMGIMFAIFAIRPESVVYGLVACVAVHGGIVAFRTASFFLYDAMHGMVVQLAIGEWIILLVSSTLLLALRQMTAAGA
ncbi:hypothetical protein [Botrimarina mediterranea]|uniref:DUF4345 domain-containing protein n=1 Tax=Botrimarina mediterranea TaxID=2528022 RepID=A0A518K826_9BACT|nr:hypothetical protein [Botrimarina mediterranea]QDV73941.1 hypothetical protein Spa11_21400 [Botrimarina mediterranea]QDV78571.1 hypothetical protein K2D_21780 [Planctomycetes bacterium K2D]